MSYLKTDPKTGLDIIEVPTSHKKLFQDLTKESIHWFGVVEKIDSNWKPIKRIAIVTNTSLYLCRLTGGIVRGCSLKELREILVNDTTAVGMVFPAPGYDLLIMMDSVQNREAIVHIAQKVKWATSGSEIRVRTLNTSSTEPMQTYLEMSIDEGMDLTERMEQRKGKEAIRHDAEAKAVAMEQVRRIKLELLAELRQSRSVEYEDMVRELERRIQLCEERDRNFAALQKRSVPINDAELWLKCPNCEQMRRLLKSHPRDDEQRISRMQADIKKNEDLITHLTEAKERLLGNDAVDNEDQKDEIRKVGKEIQSQASTNAALMRILNSSPSDARDERVMRIAQEMMVKTSALDDRGEQTREQVERDTIAERDTQIAELKLRLRESTNKQVTELNAIRTQFREYDEKTFAYLQKVFEGSVAKPRLQSGASAHDMAVAVAAAAKGQASMKHGNISREMVPSVAGSVGHASPPVPLQQQRASPQRPLPRPFSDDDLL